MMLDESTYLGQIKNLKTGEKSNSEEETCGERVHKIITKKLENNANEDLIDIYNHNYYKDITETEEPAMSTGLMNQVNNVIVDSWNEVLNDYSLLNCSRPECNLE